MGTLAFALLMGAGLPLARAMGLGRQTPGAWFAELWSLPHLYGAIGQVVFGAMPIIAIQLRNDGIRP